jgi:hypothetical protein
MSKSEKTNDLLCIIERNDEELDYYLSDVTKEQFRKDVKALMKRINDKEPIREAIKRLMELVS